MIWDKIIGHTVQVEMFRRAIARQRLAHGFLFIGPHGVGKKLFAETLAQCLFCERIADEVLDACGDCPSCRQVQAGFHPDLLRIGLPDGKKILPISLLVGDDAHRGRAGLCFELAHAPMTASRRIAIIDDAEAMNEEAANALLKTLEEPPPGAILILLAPDAESVLPTIRSRCQPLLFSPLNDAQIVQLLRATGSTAAAVEEVVSMAEGSLDVARRLLDPQLLTLWKTVEQQLRATSTDSVSAVKKVHAALDEMGSDTAAQRENMHWVVRFTIESLRKQLAATDNPLELDRLGEMLERCFLAELHLRQTMPVPLCLDALFTELGRQSRMPVM
ncbi:DNA polymerase III subunit delta' [Planctomicrobium piriforme]|uniref:DNA polymerase-3 subunit delta n=1 Tax=Planctomicrobium piriforme TaxID=1576369 RepID=A0A1I3K635_9PLAN|nr:DNA polymerase III subunit delta' [Planctomicrobium piriforme]SFI67947.1 DNA polymerase-3 subunit delta' [Planctomicrobium piriforme]